MAKAQDFRDELTVIGSELDRIVELVAGSAEEGMSIAEEQEVLDLVKGIKARTEGIKKSEPPPVGE